MLEKHGYSEEFARFAYTHGNWRDENLSLEDLLVSLADKIWKGKRIIELEEKVGQELSQKLSVAYWDVYGPLDKIIANIAMGADARITWQNR